MDIKITQGSPDGICISLKYIYFDTYEEGFEFLLEVDKAIRRVRDNDKKNIKMD